MLINPYEYAVSGGGASDPHWANVGLLILADTIGSGNVAVDDSSNALTIVGPGNAACFIASGGPFGGPYIDLANAPGGASAGFQIASSVVASGPIDCYGGDYTVEGWFKPRDGDVTTEALFFAIGNSVQMNVGNYTGFLYGGVDGGGGLTSAAISLNVWHHVAIVMISDAFVIYLDGVATNSPISVTRFTWGSRNFSVGGYTAGPLYGGAVSNVRVTKGIGRYTTNFTPPTAPFPNH